MEATAAGSGVAERVAALRLEFDQSFAQPRAAQGAEPVKLLILRAADKTYALRLAELSGLRLGMKIVPLPGAGAEFLGIAGFRGKIVPVYSLARLLGDEPGEGEEERRWLALCGGDAPVALACSRFEGHRQADPQDIIAAAASDRPQALGEQVRIDGVLYPLLGIAAMLNRIEQRAGEA